MKATTINVFAILSLSVLPGLAALQTVGNLPVSASMLKQAPASLWTFPRNSRVSFERWNNNDFEVFLGGFPDSRPQPEDANVCWAYCASQVLQYDGIDTTPQELVDKVRAKRKGKSLRGDSGTIIDIIKPLWGSGRYIGLATPNAQQLAHALTLDSPVIMALKPKKKGDVGHAVVLTGLRFSFYGQIIFPSAFRVYDPLSGKVERIRDEEDVEAFAKRIEWCIYFTDYRRP